MTDTNYNKLKDNSTIYLVVESDLSYYENFKTKHNRNIVYSILELIPSINSCFITNKDLFIQFFFS